MRILYEEAGWEMVNQYDIFKGIAREHTQMCLQKVFQWKCFLKKQMNFLWGLQWVLRESDEPEHFNYQLLLWFKNGKKFWIILVYVINWSF